MSDTIGLGSVLGEMIKVAERNIPNAPDDYIGEDGLWHCGKCHTNKQYRFKALGKEITVKCLCKCAQEQREKAKQAEEAEKEAFRRQRIREAAFSDRGMRSCTFETDDQKDKRVSTIARGYAAEFNPKQQNGLLLSGDSGTGKSFYAACITNEVISKGFSAKFTSLSEIERDLWSSDKEEIYAHLKNISLLVIDDFGAERDTPYMQEIAYNVIDGRYKAGKPMIITTNLSKEYFANAKEIWQKRLFSRMAGACLPVEVKGDDRRKDKGKEVYIEKIERLMKAGQALSS